MRTKAKHDFVQSSLGTNYQRHFVQRQIKQAEQLFMGPRSVVRESRGEISTLPLLVGHHLHHSPIKFNVNRICLLFRLC